MLATMVRKMPQKSVVKQSEKTVNMPKGFVDIWKIDASEGVPAPRFGED